MTNINNSACDVCQNAGAETIIIFDDRIINHGALLEYSKTANSGNGGIINFIVFALSSNHWKVRGNNINGSRENRRPATRDLDLKHSSIRPPESISNASKAGRLLLRMKLFRPKKIGGKGNTAKTY